MREYDFVSRIRLRSKTPAHHDRQVPADSESEFALRHHDERMTGKHGHPTRKGSMTRGHWSPQSTWELKIQG
jgi:hypothetical protein